MLASSLVPTTLCLLLSLTAVNVSAKARADLPWSQYAKNPFVIQMNFPIAEDSAGGIIAADVTGDGLIDYLVTRPGKIGAYAHNGNRLWVLDIDVQIGGSSEAEGLPGHHGSGVQAGDIDGDGRTEVVFLTKDGHLNVVDGKTGKNKLRKKMDSPKGSERWEHVIIANFRGKGDRDLLLQATNKSGYRMGKYVAAFVYDKLDAPIWQTDKYLGCAHTGARMADIDLDGRDEVLGATIIDHDGKITQPCPVKGHLDSTFVYDVLPDVKGLEVVALEEGGGNRVFLFNRDKLFWETHYDHQEPQNAAVGEFAADSPGLEIWCRSRYNTHQKPFTFDSKGKLLSHYEMDAVAPKGWTDSGVEVIWAIDWTGDKKQLAAAKERHKEGDVCLFDPVTGKFMTRIPEKADRLYVADVSGDWREEIIVVSGSGIRIYHNPDKNPNPSHPRLWKSNPYRRSKMTWNYYSP